MPKRKLDNKIILGVCSGLAEYYNLDVTMIRIVFILFTLTFGIGILAYIVLALLMSSDYTKSSSKVIDIDQNKKNLASLLIFLGLIILLSYSSLFRIISSALFWGIFLILSGLNIIRSEKKFTILSVIVILVISIILTIIINNIGLIFQIIFLILITGTFN